MPVWQSLLPPRIIIVHVLSPSDDRFFHPISLLYWLSIFENRLRSRQSHAWVNTECICWPDPIDLFFLERQLVEWWALRHGSDQQRRRSTLMKSILNYIERDLFDSFTRRKRVWSMSTCSAMKRVNRTETKNESAKKKKKEKKTNLSVCANRDESVVAEVYLSFLFS